MNKSIILLFCILSFSCGESAETQSKENEVLNKKTTQTYVIASPMTGTLARNGSPIPNAKIIRVLSWNGNEDGTKQEFLTDNAGKFDLPIHEESLSLNILTQFVAKTRLYYSEISDETLLWYNSKMDPELNSETGEPINNLICDVNNDRSPVYIGDSMIASILTRCKWKGMPTE